MEALCDVYLTAIKKKKKTNQKTLEHFRNVCVCVYIYVLYTKKAKQGIYN